MATKNTAPTSKTKGSQKNHRAIPSREKHPERKLLRILRSSGLVLASEYAEHFGLQAELKKSYFIDAVARYNHRKEDRLVVAQPAPIEPDQPEQSQP